MESEKEISSVVRGKRCALLVDTGAIRANARYIKEKTGKMLIAVVKANAYGHGLEQTVNALCGTADLFAVATADEALRAVRFGAKAWVMSPLSKGETAALKGTGVAVTVEDEDGAKAAAKYGLPVHVAVDTGMRRYGVDWRDVGKLLRICDVEGLCTQGIFTHFSCADGQDLSSVREQEKRFENAVDVLGKRRFEYIHCAASAAALRTSPYGNAVRAGLALYGVLPDFCTAPLKEVSRLYARVIITKILEDGDAVGYGAAYTARGKKRIAVIGAGYGDGFPYLMKKCGSVFINGFVCPVVGNVCMDCAFVDVTNARVKEGDLALVFGGEGETSFRAAARKTGEIPYSLMTGIGGRAERVYV